MSPKVVVTGLGIVSPLGVGSETVHSALMSRVSASRSSPVSARGIPVPGLAATVGALGEKVEEIVSPKYLRRLPSVSRWSLGAAVDASSRAVVPAEAEPSGGDETAVILGTSFGASSYHFEYYEKLFRNGLKDASPLLFSESVMNAPSGHVAIYLKLRGASLALVGGEEVGLGAILDAHDRLALGECSTAYAGGAEEYCDFVHAALAARGRIFAEPGEAYCERSKGTILCEGAAFLRLEIERPGRRTLARLVGTAMARSLQGIRGARESVADAVREALERASVDPGSVGLVVTSASGGLLDGCEARGIAAGLSLNHRAGPAVPICAPMTILGEGFAFTSAAQAVIAVQLIAAGSIPPSRATPGAAELPRGLRLVTEPERFVGTHVLVVSTSWRGNAVAALLERT